MERGIREGINSANTLHNRSSTISLDIYMIPGDTFSYIKWIAWFCTREIKKPTILLGTESQHRVMKGLINPASIKAIDSKITIDALCSFCIYFAATHKHSIELSEKKWRRKHSHQHFYREYRILSGYYDHGGEGYNGMTKRESSRKNRIMNRMGVSSNCELYLKYRVLQEYERIHKQTTYWYSRRANIRNEVISYISDCFIPHI